MFGKRKFGLREAEAASIYTNTEGERRSVLEVLGVLGVKTTVIEEADTICRRLNKEIEITDAEIARLRAKTIALDELNDERGEEVEDINELVKDWVL